GYVDQSHAGIDNSKSVYEVISGGQETIRLGGRDINVRAFLSRFNFAGADQEKKCGALSGGERNRLHLAMTLKEEANVLLLDEP
ncbi:MAG TPA: energy-dependent translational throttle protein EttA, partial [Marinilabiliaceae bacterium]|nr:energy-dependent translational throttle protein EttA [Marinilabiliaceae bacterium]